MSAPALRRPMLTVALLAVFASAGCKAWFSNVATRDLPKLYVQEQSIFIRSEWDGRPASQADVNTFQDTIAQYKTPGFFTRSIPGAREAGAPAAGPAPEAQLYLFAEPLLTIAVTNPAEVPNATGQAPAGNAPAAVGQAPVNARPSFFLREMSVKWEIPGFELPAEQKIALNTTLKTNTYQLPRIPVTYPGAVIRDIQQARGLTKGIRGTMTVQVLARDLDPLASEAEREVRLVHPLPVLFTSGNVLIAEAIANSSPLPAPAAPGGVAAQAATPAPSGTPSASATVTPSASPSVQPGL